MMALIRQCLVAAVLFGFLGIPTADFASASTGGPPQAGNAAEQVAKKGKKKKGKKGKKKRKGKKGKKKNAAVAQQAVFQV
jgi:hypothetical protein